MLSYIVVQEQQPNLEDVYYRGIRRILSVTSLVAGGAEFEDGRLSLTADQIDQITHEDPTSEQEIPRNLLLTDLDTLTLPEAKSVADEKFQEARAMLRTAYRAKRIAQTVERLDPTQPAAYIQTIRDFIQQSSDDKRQYNLGDPATTGFATGDMDTVTSDIRCILPHRELKFETHRWTEAFGDGRFIPHEPSRYPAEDGFINHALALYGITARMALHAQEYNVSLPDIPISMRDLSETRRHDILQTIYQEWREFMVDLPGNLSSRNMRSKRSLLYRNIGELHAAYDQYPQLDRVHIATIFISHPHAFHNELPAIAAHVDRLRSDGRDPRQLAFTERELELRERAATALSKGNQYAFSEDLDPGETVYLERTEDVDHVIFSALARLDANATQLYGPPLRNVWKSGTIGKSTAEKLIPKKFYGKLENPRVVILPIDDEFIDDYLQPLSSNAQIDRDSLVRLATLVDMRSTGRGIIGQSMIDIILYTRDIADAEQRNHVLSIRGIASGQRLVNYVAAEASENARSILEYAMKNPFSGGLMSPR